MDSTIRRAMPKLVSKSVLKKLYEEERKHDNTGLPFEFIHAALTNDDLEHILPTTKTTLTSGIHQVNNIPQSKHKDKKKAPINKEAEHTFPMNCDLNSYDIDHPNDEKVEEINTSQSC